MVGKEGEERNDWDEDCMGRKMDERRRGRRREDWEIDQKNR